MAHALVSGLLTELGSITGQQLKQEVCLVVGVDKDIQQMSTTLKSIQVVLDDAEEKQFKDQPVKVWLDQLKNAAYDIEDVLEEWSTKILRSEHEGDDNAQILKKVYSFLFSLCNCFGLVSLRYGIGHKIKELKEKLDAIAIEKDKYHLNATGRTEEPSRRMTSSVIDVLEVCGRTQDKDTLVSKLLSESSRQENDVPVISIVGLGGMGKTTLAQIIYNDDRVKNYFEKRMWICVSEPFDQIRLAKAIIEAIGETVPNTIEWDPLHQHLCNAVRGKQFLLVLDDVWTEDRTEWSPLKSSLNGGAQGSRIVVTTRNNGVAKMISSTYMHDLTQLSVEDCWLIFSRIAFQGRREEDCEKLEEIGKEITKKGKGVPLFVKTLGGLMFFKSTRLEWQQVLDSDAWKLQDVEERVMPALLLSYYALPSQVKRCFAYCSTFPKDSILYKDDLIKLWMAQGFLGTAGRRELEVVGAESFDNLAMRSFFQDFRRDGDGNIIYCKMHDLVHDFAQFLTDTECSIIDGDNPEFNTSEIVRHLNVQNMDSDSTLPSIYKVKNLRTLMIHRRAPLHLPALSDLFCRLTCLKALSFIGNRDLEELPNEVEKLIHLKYFDLSETSLKELPETMSKLFNLQTLRLKKCRSLCKLPKGIGKMINLRHLEIEGTDDLSYMPRGIGKLNSLRTLHKFIVGGVSGGGCRIGELKDLKLLQGDLKISGLERLSDGNEASEAAKLKDKQYLHGLALKFDENVAEGEIEKMERVLEGLQPHRNLEKLEINGYPGSKFPCWMVDSMLPNLLTVELHGCKKWVQFPPLGRFPYLQKLKVTRMDGIIKLTGKHFGGIVGNDGSVKVFPKLKELRVDGMANLEEWDFRGEDGEINMLHGLSILRLWGFPKLKVLPTVGNLSVLVKLKIRGMDSIKRVGLEFLGIMEVGSKKRTDHTVVVFPHLEILYFSEMTEWEEWEMLESEGVVIMPRLHSLSLCFCPKLKELPHQIFPATLKELTIYNCPKLNWTRCLPPHLEELTLWEDAGVLSRSLPIDGTSNHLKTLIIVSSKHSSLPEGLARLTSLQHLKIHGSDSLKCMPEELRHLTSIQQLIIIRCSILGPRCRKEVGEDWSIISHIPHIYIDDEMSGKRDKELSTGAREVNLMEEFPQHEQVVSMADVFPSHSISISKTRIDR